MSYREHADQFPAQMQSLPGLTDWVGDDQVPMATFLTKMDQMVTMYNQQEAHLRDKKAVRVTMLTIIDGWKRRASKNAVLITVLESLKALVQLNVQENAEFSWETSHNILQIRRTRLSLKC